MSQAASVRISVVSSMLASVAYSIDATLDLEFHTGATYRYFAVPEAVFQGLIAAESKGAYFNRNLKNRFPYQRLA
jgi:hypothetical protein